MKAMHREIMLSATYALERGRHRGERRGGSDNRLLWRANWQRLDAEALRDSLLFVSGNLDLQAGGPPVALEREEQAAHGLRVRQPAKLDPMLALFDFPNPNNTSEQRVVTNVPLQRLFFMNSSFVEEQAEALAKRAERRRSRSGSGRRIAFCSGGRRRTRNCELGHGVRRGSSGWNEYAQVLLSSNEFEWVN